MLIWKTKYHKISQEHPYFIADVGSNHEGDIDRAIMLCDLIRKSGGHAVKFQHFKAETIVSDRGFRSLPAGSTHQDGWVDSVFDTYKKYEYKREWDDTIIQHCNHIGLDYLTTPYDFAAVNTIIDKLDIIKIGSGDASWLQFLEYIAKYKKPMLLATGASTLQEVRNAVTAIQGQDCPLAILQCNTNYTGDEDNFNFVNLNVLKAYQNEFPQCLYGLSDHTPGYATALGAIALGACIIEKHFTDDKSRKGPDHHFAMDPQEWKEMIIEAYRLKNALGDGTKKIESNELGASVVQRRSICASKDLQKGDTITHKNTEMLRPYPFGAYSPAQLDEILGKTINRSTPKGSPILKDYIDDA